MTIPSFRESESFLSEMEKPSRYRDEDVWEFFWSSSAVADLFLRSKNIEVIIPYFAKNRNGGSISIFSVNRPFLSKKLENPLLGDKIREICRLFTYYIMTFLRKTQKSCNFHKKINDCKKQLKLLG